MGRKTVLLDDFDGSELPDETKPVNLSLGRTTYALYLSDENHGKLMKALEPFIENAETTETTVRASSTATRAASAAKSDKDKLKRVRAWAQNTGYKFKGADGEERTLGDRGRIPDEVIKAYEESEGDE